MNGRLPSPDNVAVRYLPFFFKGVILNFSKETTHSFISLDVLSLLVKLKVLSATEFLCSSDDNWLGFSLLGFSVEDNNNNDFSHWIGVILIGSKITLPSIE